MFKHFFSVWAPALTLVLAVAFLPACQKETISSAADAALTFSAEDRGGDAGGLAEHRRRHHHDLLRHPHDSLRHHPHDSIYIVHHGHHPHGLDSTFTGGPHHPHDTIGNGCNKPPVAITVTDLPAAAQAWLTANAAGAEIKSVLKVTRRDCKVEYIVRVKGRQPIVFDADGKKK